MYVYVFDMFAYTDPIHFSDGVAGSSRLHSVGISAHPVKHISAHWTEKFEREKNVCQKSPEAFPLEMNVYGIWIREAAMFLFLSLVEQEKNVCQNLLSLSL